MLTSTFWRLLPPLSPAVPQSELEHPAFQPDAPYTVALGNVIVDVGAIVSTTTETEATPGDVQLRNPAVTRYSYVPVAGGESSQDSTLYGFGVVPVPQT